MIWLSFQRDSPISNHVLTLFYSFFSHVFWPIFIPFAIWMLEPNPPRRKLILYFQVTGLIVGFYLLYSLIKFSILSKVLGTHIAYEAPHFYIVAVMALYLLSTCVSCMISSSRIVQIFGVLSFVTFIAAYFIHAATFVSVWCFFVAILSSIVYLFFRQRRVDRRLVKTQGTLSTIP